jgi:hypothetical protein
MNGLELQEELHSVLEKIEETRYLLEDGKEIHAHKKLLGIRQKLSTVYDSIKKENESNKNK